MRNRRLIGLPWPVLAMCWLWVLYGLSHAQPALPEIGLSLGSWRFDDTNWLGRRGTLPLSWTNAQLVETWHSNGVRLTGSAPAYLNYPWVETNGWTNLSIARGSLWMWLRPLWSGTNAGGTGPGSSARLFDIGTYTGDASIGWWSLHLNSEGTRLYFGAQTNGSTTLYLDAPVQWTNNTWHFITLNYTHTNSVLFLDGVFATNGPGVTTWPSATVLSNGFFIGSDSAGTNLFQGDFEMLRTYDGLMPESLIYGHYTNRMAIIEGSGGGGGGGSFAPEGGGGEGGEGFGPEGVLMLVDPSYANTNFEATISGGTSGIWYDFFRTTNFVSNYGTNAQWLWMGQGTNLGRYLFPNVPPPHAFYVLGTPQDSDSDGMTDAWETLVSKTSTNVPQPPFKVFITQPPGGTLP